MKKGIQIPPAVTVVVIILVVALIGFFGYKAILPPQRVQMSPQAMNGMKQHMAGQGAAASASGQRYPGPGGMSGQHSQ